MADLWWLVVTLPVLLSPVKRSAAVDQNQLGRIVNEILNRYTPHYPKNGNEIYPMFSLAVTIPYNSETKAYDVNQVLDSGKDVKKTILNCDVYVGRRVVAATLLRWKDVVHQCPDGRVQWDDVIAACPETVKTWADVKKKCGQKKIPEGRADHAEYRVLQKFPSFTKEQQPNKKDLLLFYVLASPCDKKCTNTDDAANILDSIKQIKQWDDYAFVFSKVFKPRNGAEIPENTLIASLERLANHDPDPIGLSNIFRCSEGVCASCSSNKKVLPYCYSDESQRGSSSLLPSSSFTQPEQGTSGSTSPKDKNIKMSAGRSSDADSDIRAGQGGSSPGLGRDRKGGQGARNPKKKASKPNKLKSLFCCSGK